MFFNFLGVWIGQWLYIFLKTSICLNHSVWINLIFSMRPLLFDFWVGLQWIKHFFFFIKLLVLAFVLFKVQTTYDENKWYLRNVWQFVITFTYCLPSEVCVFFLIIGWFFFFFFLFMYLIWVMWWFNTHSSDDNLWLTHCIVFRSYLMTHLSFLLFPLMVY